MAKLDWEQKVLFGIVTFIFARWIGQYSLTLTRALFFVAQAACGMATLALQSRATSPKAKEEMRVMRRNNVLKAVGIFAFHHFTGNTQPLVMSNFFNACALVESQAMAE